MSKTNHRVNKDRGEKLSESQAHKKRRQANQRLADIADLYDLETIDIEELYDEEELVTYEKIKRSH